jgi:hypothetical protein
MQIGNLYHHRVLGMLATRTQSYLEIGVQEGDSLAAVVAANREIDVTLCDPWDANHGGTNRGSHHHIQERLNTLAHRGKRCYLDGFSSVEIPKIDCQHFDLIHVDGDHSYEGCKNDLKMCWPMTLRYLVVHDVFFQEVRDAAFQFLEWHHAEFGEVSFSASDHGTLVIERER